MYWNISFSRNIPVWHSLWLCFLLTYLICGIFCVKFAGFCSWEREKKISQILFYFNISVCAAFPWLQNSDLRLALPTKLKMVLESPKMKELIFSHGSKRANECVWFGFGVICVVPRWGLQPSHSISPCCSPWVPKQEAQSVQECWTQVLVCPHPAVSFPCLSLTPCLSLSLSLWRCPWLPGDTVGHLGHRGVTESPCDGPSVCCSRFPSLPSLD